jgi:hypothetical protein
MDQFEKDHKVLPWGLTGNYEEDKPSHDELVDIVELQADIGSIDVHLQWVTAIGNACVEDGLTKS